MTERPAYTTPAAFRRALTDRLRSIAAEGRWSLPQLQRHVAYDRLLERLYLLDDGWIVKGATALLARDLGMRGTVDVDVYRARGTASAEADLREAVSRDIGDWFRFEVAPARPVGEAEVGWVHAWDPLLDGTAAGAWRPVERHWGHERHENGH